MPPPSTNPIRRARSEFFDEPMEPEFFVPIGQGRTSFGQYIAPSRAVASGMKMRDFYSQLDEQDTQSAERFTKRLELGSRNRILPYSERATIAEQKLAREKAESGRNLNPFNERRAMEETQLETEQAQAARQMLPSAQKLQGLQTQDAIESIESGEKDIQRDKIDPLAYDFNLRTIQAANPKLDVKEAQRQARNAALRMRNDAPYIEAIEEEALQTADPRFRVKFLEDVRDPETGARFTRIRDDAPQDQVAAFLRKNTYNRARVAREQEERRATQGKSREQVLVLDKLADGVRSEIKSLEMGAGDKADLPALKAKLKKYEDRLEKMLDESVAPMSLDDQDLAKPGN